MELLFNNNKSVEVKIAASINPPNPTNMGDLVIYNVIFYLLCDQ